MRSSIILGLICIFLIFTASASWGESSDVPEVTKDTRCPVCGMFVKKYAPWITQLVSEDGEVKAFDGVKDLMAYYFEPELYGGKQIADSIIVWVKDYYSQSWINGKEAFYVGGSDVMGPMGHELIPFLRSAAAENFMNDHKGTALLRFSDITLEMISDMRKGHKMKKKHMAHDKMTPTK